MECSWLVGLENRDSRANMEFLSGRVESTSTSTTKQLSFTSKVVTLVITQPIRKNNMPPRTTKDLAASVVPNELASTIRNMDDEGFLPTEWYGVSSLVSKKAAPIPTW